MKPAIGVQEPSSGRHAEWLVRGQGLLIKTALKRLLGRKILAGPFRGMRFLGYTATSVLMPKIVGTYEKELHPVLQPILEQLSGRVVVVGAGEGYYAVGMLYKNGNIIVRSFDLDPRAQNAQRTLAELNGVTDRLEINGRCDPGALRRALTGGADLLLVDVEGDERILLDPVHVPALLEQRMIVEIHDSIDAKISEVMQTRFGASHAISLIPWRGRSPSDIEPWRYRMLSIMSARAARVLLWERVPDTGWMYLVPRAMQKAAQRSKDG